MALNSDDIFFFLLRNKFEYFSENKSAKNSHLLNNPQVAERNLV